MNKECGGVKNEVNDNVCRDYERGVCHRGNKCKFDHPPDMKIPKQERLPICRDFQNGKCDRSNCKYMHITSHEEQVYMRTGQLPNQKPTNSSGGGGPPGRISNLPGGDQVCKDFLNKICNRGNNCKFLHISEDEYQRHRMNSGDGSRKRRRESPLGMGAPNSMDMQFYQEENDMLRRKVADLQRQVADLRTMNDTLYDQNSRYRSQMQGMETSRPTTQYSSYNRETAEYNYLSPAPRNSSNYDLYP